MAHNPGKIELPPSVSAEVLDLPALNEHQVTKVGLTVAAGTTSAEDKFPAVELFESADDGDTYYGIQAIHGEAIRGRVSGTALGGGTSSRLWDYTNTVNVAMDKDDDELSTESAEDVAAGRVNWMLIGREVVGFTTVELLSSGPRTYKLSNLLRGRRGTEEWIEDHADAERVVLLTPPSGIKFVETGYGNLNSERLYKLVPAGVSVEEVDETIQLTPKGESIKQLPPILRVQRKNESSGDLHIEWIRRSKSIFRLFSGVIPPVHDCCCAGRYVVEIWADDRSAVKRTVEVEDAESFNYTSAMQTEDFGGSKSSVEVNVYQLGEGVGRGRPAKTGDIAMANDPIFSWPLLAAGTAQGELQVNELLARMIACTLRVNSFGDTSPPGSPAEFDAYIIGASATGAWSGFDDKIGIYLNAAWIFVTPVEGMQVRVVDDNIVITYDGSAWSAIDGHQTLTDGANIAWNMALGPSAQVTLGGNRTIDAPSNIVNGRIYRLHIIQDGTGSRTLTWAAGVFKWPGGVAPTLSTGAADQDVFEFYARGGALYGREVGKDYA